MFKPLSVINLKIIRITDLSRTQTDPCLSSRAQLLGSIDLDTREWTNGVLTVAALQAVDEPDEVNTWIVCDGDIDPEWVESLNSVLDDNRDELHINRSSRKIDSQ